MDGGPIRRCAGCRARRPRSELIRVASGPDGTVSVDPRARMPGRGAYLCVARGCVEKAASSGRLARALHRTAVPEGLLAELRAAVSHERGSEGER
jgi:predicted RNA-binding protein YlxR (DUF448 family)